MAEREREMISRRTKDGLAAAKARGVKLGKLNLDSVRNTDTTKATAARQAKATERNAKLLSVMEKHLPTVGGRFSQAMLAEKLNDAGLKTARGKPFTAMQVSRIKAAA